MLVRLEALGQFTQDESKTQIVSIASLSVILSDDVIVNEAIGEMFLVYVWKYESFFSLKFALRQMVEREFAEVKNLQIQK